MHTSVHNTHVPGFRKQGWGRRRRGALLGLESGDAEQQLEALVKECEAGREATRLSSRIRLLPS